MISYAFRELSESEYFEFIKNQKTNNFLQSLNAYHRYKQTNREVFLLGLVGEKEVKAAGLVVKINEICHRKIFSIPYGPILDYELNYSSQVLEAFSSGTKSFLKSVGGSVLQISPYCIFSEKIDKTLRLLGYKNLGEYIQAKWIAVRSFDGFSPKNKDAFLASFRKTHRQNIRKAINRYRLEIRPLNRSKLNILFEEVGKAAKKHSFATQPQSYYDEMFEAFGSKVKIVAAFYEGKPIAASMFIIYGNEITYLYSGADPEYAKVCGQYAIQWHMLCYALKRNIPRYNFFGTRPDESDGVFQFKLGFRAKIEELQGTYMLPLDVFGKIYTMRKKYHKFDDVV